MLTLIAESKRMTRCDRQVASEQLTAHTPVSDSTATQLMASWRDLSAEELSEAIGISMNLAKSMQRMIYDFPDKSTGSPAIEAFTGVVFKALSYATLDEPSRRSIDSSVAIVSSLYGLLRPADIIKAYRLDFATRLAPSDTPMFRFWHDEVTSRIADSISRDAQPELLDLLPAEASKCIGWDSLQKVAKVRRVEFKEVGASGCLATPKANRLKTLRGLLLRQIAREGVTTLAQLATLESDDYMPSPDNSAESESIIFLS